MGATIFLHKHRRSPRHLLGNLEPLHAAEQSHNLAALGRSHPSGDLGQAHDADRQWSGRMPGLDKPVLGRRFAAQMLDQHVAVDQDHSSASRSR
jgi:hypothetical protein